MSQRWFAIQSKASAEIKVEQKLQQLSYETFCPKYLKEQRISGGRIKNNSYAWFPRYLFVRFNTEEDQWREVVRLDGVSSLLGLQKDGRVCSVRDEVIDVIRSAADDGGYMKIEALNGSIRFLRGDNVRVVRGGFEGRIGKVFRSEKGRVDILLSLLGRESRVQVPEDNLEKLENRAAAS